MARQIRVGRDRVVTAGAVLYDGRKRRLGLRDHHACGTAAACTRSSFPRVICGRDRRRRHNFPRMNLVTRFNSREKTKTDRAQSTARKNASLFM